MNSTPEELVGLDDPDGLDELGELARLLPVPPVERGLPSGRHSHHQDVLMQLIDRDRDRDRDLDRDLRVRQTRRFLRPALVAGAVAVAAAVVAGLTVGIGGSGEHGGRTGTGRSGVSSAGGGDGRSAVATLGRIAAVAMRTDVKPVDDGQFVYVRTKVAGNEGVFDGPVKLGEPHERQVWFSQRQGPVIDVGLIREFGQDWPIEVGVPDGEDPTGAGNPAGYDRPTYAWLAALPTDPAALLKLLYADTHVEQGEDKDQEVFIRIGDLIGEQIMPSAIAAAFYQATARIPGVTEVPDAVDAAGRHGIGIAHEDTAEGTRREWIFDRTTLEYLGERVVFSRDTERAKAGTVYHTTAVLERAVVDKRGQEPGERRRAGRS
ncbi:hypothetical protein SAMN04487983_1004139 [Streptomyces sp. yr375]|uniref:CU044_5270 family protein n=1 Tax=Streptomyces sp. yr375 TaxID=1761906 RepID=UPI0008D2AB53|nr:CU044_5270 family protein [Streptomyces sp. yr375]SEQ31764.1 hypothetical protein SAMN04487983_1004139 [Streptomyces sp. yr375]